MPASMIAHRITDANTGRLAKNLATTRSVSSNAEPEPSPTSVACTGAPGPILVQAFDDQLVAGPKAPRHQPAIADRAIGDERARLGLAVGSDHHRGRVALRVVRDALLRREDRRRLVRSPGRAPRATPELHTGQQDVLGLRKLRAQRDRAGRLVDGDLANYSVPSCAYVEPSPSTSLTFVLPATRPPEPSCARRRKRSSLDSVRLTKIGSSERIVASGPCSIRGDQRAGGHGRLADAPGDSAPRPACSSTLDPRDLERGCFLRDRGVGLCVGAARASSASCFDTPSIFARAREPLVLGFRRLDRNQAFALARSPSPSSTSRETSRDSSQEHLAGLDAANSPGGTTRLDDPGDLRAHVRRERGRGAPGANRLAASPPRSCA